MWAMNPLPSVRLTLVSDQSHTPYSGMLPGYIAGVYNFGDCHIDLRILAQAAGAQYVAAPAIGLDLEHQRVQCRGRSALRFDLVSLDIGSTPDPEAVPGIELAMPAKPVHRFLADWEAWLTVLAATAQPQVVLMIVGGGAGGVELALAGRSRLLHLPHQPQVDVHLLQRGPELLPGHAPAVRRIFRRLLAEAGIQVHCNAPVQRLEPAGSGVRLISGELAVEGDRCFWVTQARGAGWLAASGLQTDASGFVLVDDSLRSLSHPVVFAAGDVATMVNAPRPKAGVFAVRQGRPLFENLRRALRGAPLHPYHPQRHLLALIGTGDRRAVASRGGWGVGPSALLWAWKDRIDRRFMAQFSQLSGRISATASDSPEAAAPTMYCAGCGAKVGSSSLSRVLERLQALQPEGKDIPVGLQTPDDAAVLRLPGDRPLVQTVDVFPALVSDPYVFGQIVANHCLNDLWAMNADPHSAQAIVTVPHGNEAVVEETLFQVLSGGLSVLAACQTPLVGGHTTEGNELVFGLVCNGLAEEAQLWRKGGIQPGNALILTKALGTGTLFAAANRGLAKGHWIDGAIAQMLQSQQAAVQVLRQFTVHACTDITGFGLLGHLVEMVRASSVAVQLEVNALPWLSGAAETLSQGIFSSLHPQNQRASNWIENWAEIGQDPLLAILFDPQTSGGLLAALPADQAEPCLMALQAAGYSESRCIGQAHGLAPNQLPVTLN
jgi:selenide,water dikinase